MIGYPGTPLAYKLGIKAGSRLYVSGAPKDYLKLISPLPRAVSIVKRPDSTTDIAHFFSSSRSELALELPALKRALREDAAIWVSWPKKSSGVRTDITEDVVRVTAFSMGLVDIKVCAVDETWSALKLVLRRELRTEASEKPAGKR